ncbi:2-oxoglutarate dehydrogenase E2 component [Schinkia azotoformans MEV2011]|uniref:Dihydrolipoyllysine-residue succinyltransferase component of 2-oxoglutarate dehydrogenase complex n=1 Tax=Schinkia azotoformans MEV2011 TaxID=1348973 RepID=A0A072NTS5_SCHAZ|nr:2-oxoglutarate dehydrogenase complex dihydrolipoyllysine-residue succinyltransferase [Schinkia azotoformans]KEF36605.1 2-oxoglutarate dehydrogenase E2 component [Schinkia azotoformans MEV2011]MEC1695570.1 2-oxoglutarate dehydrogenase complex dihydrolipoyllysine-residue succinyltransferase [Schinkia azotoformans]MEC1714253.1 2-oxoglutarate dehydrogenase complex dihydrolipoyllysine-residue succinyltransferase [Schinkia azotoformans]MEC1723965.1 2-oxoglutarate dehydrogenase complex dihydrolipoy
MMEIKVPELAESINEGTIAEWLKQEGDYVQNGEPIAELETDKINVEINSVFSGVIKQLLFMPGDTVQVGQVIAVLDENENHFGNVPEPELKPESLILEKEKPNNNLVASPAARKRARELGVSLDEIPYKDPLGRIRVEDVEDYKKSHRDLTNNEPNHQQANTVTKNQSNQLKVDEKDQQIERVKMSRRRQTIANRLLEAQHNAAMLTTFNEVDMTAIMDVRNRRKESFNKKHGVKLGFMSFFTKAVIGALKEFPFLNAEIQGDEILIKKFYDIGVAVSTDDGLVVPVVREADRLSFAGIEKEIGVLSEKARNKSLGLKDLQGGTFTITNGGIFGSLYSTPILNAPQVGILGMHKIQRRPVVIDDEDTIEVRPMMYIALSYDHRIIDGKDAVQFLVKIKELLESPEDLLLEG